MAEKIRMGWYAIEAVADVLANLIRPHNPQLLVAVARGGLIPCTILSHRLKVPMTTISAQAYRGQDRSGEVSVLGWDRAFNSPDVWVIDDIHDTGDTLRAIENRNGGEALFQYGALFRRQDIPMRRGTSVLELAPGWVVFPWETE